jgi:Domain of unknown function (DUF1840)
MLVRFDSKAGTITMFGDVAKQLLRLMGQSGAIPGAILAPDIPPAVERLRQGISGQAEKTGPRNTQDEGEPPVNVRQRAFPLIELLERAAKQKADVIWEEERRTAF